MWRWILRISAVFLFGSLFLTSPASAHPHFFANFGVPGVSIGFGHPGYYYPHYYYPRYYHSRYYYPGYYYPGYAYSYRGYVYGYPGYTYPRYGYAWHGGYRGYYGHRYYGGGGRYVRNGNVGWHGGRGHWRR